MSHTTRVAPTNVGGEFDDGQNTKITFSLDPDVEFWESVTGAPGFDAGDPIPMTTHFNSAVHTAEPPTLKRFTPFQVQGKIGKGTVDALYAICGQKNGWVTITWPDGTQYSIPAYLKSFQPGQAQAGSPLEGTIEIVPTMRISGSEQNYMLAPEGSGT